MEANTNSRKQSVLLGGLISTAGIFISKFLGLIYVVPFDAILQSAANKAYYSQTYSIYSYVLQIATAGLPFAVATLVARYAAREDYRTCLLVKKISFFTMALLGFIAGVVLITLSGFIAASVCPSDGDVVIMKNAIILISISLFIIPILSSIRGFYQGLKEMEIYSMSQVLEQIVRIVFLLGVGAFIVYVLDMDAVWALYFSVIAASVAGALTIFYVQWKGKNKYREVKELAKLQTDDTKVSSKVLFKELIVLSIPYLLTAIFGYSDQIINQMDLGPGLEAFGKMVYDNNLSTAIFMHATKIIAIPMILATGFSSAIIPYITSALENKNIKQVHKYILDCMDSVLYLALPMCFLLFLLAKPVMFTMFGASNIELDVFTMKWYTLVGFVSTVGPILTSTAMALGYRDRAILNSIIYAFTKLLTNRLFISLFGFGGLVLSTVLAAAVCACLNIILIQKNFHVKWIYTLRKLLFMILGLVAIYVVLIPFDMMGWIDYLDSRLISLCMLGVMGIVSVLVYVLVTGLFQVPQLIFNVDVKTLIQKVKGKLSR